MRMMRRMARGMSVLAITTACCIGVSSVAWSWEYLCFSGSDWDGDYRGEPAVWRPSNGLWFVSGVTRFSYGGGSYWGQYDIPVLWVSPFTTFPYHSQPGIFRQKYWHLKYDFVYAIEFGQPEDCPVPGNYDGVNADNIAIFRDYESGLWSVLDKTRFHFGQDGDLPVPGDWLGLGQSIPAIFRSGYWSIRGAGSFIFGAPGDIPVPGNYSDVYWQAAIFRPTTGMWAIRGLTRFYFGSMGDWPIAADLGRTAFQTADWNDDPVIFRPSQGLWRIRGAFYGGGNRMNLGIDGDIPVAGPRRW